LFAFARDIAGLDLFCLSEHDWQMNEEDWKELTATSDHFDEPGRFVTPRLRVDLADLGQRFQPLTFGTLRPGGWRDEEAAWTWRRPCGAGSSGRSWRRPCTPGFSGCG
jgi:hypothetical protein